MVKKIKFIIEYFLLIVFGGFFSKLPTKVAILLGASIGKILYYVDKKHKEVALKNLEDSFPEKSEEQRKAIAKQVYKNLGKVFIEFLHINSIINNLKLEIEGKENLDSALKNNRGVIAIGGHLGNWELLGAIIVKLGYKLSAIYFEQRNYLSDKYFNKIREKAGIKLIPKKNSLKLSLKALKENNLLGLIADQDAGRNGVFVNFLGRPASVAKGPVIFAMKTKAPMLVFTLIRKEDGGYKLFISEPVKLKLTDDFNSDVKENTQRWSDIFEQKVKEYPEQWFWVHRRWATRPPA